MMMSEGGSAPADLPLEEHIGKGKKCSRRRAVRWRSWTRRSSKQTRIAGGLNLPRFGSHPPTENNPRRRSWIAQVGGRWTYDPEAELMSPIHLVIGESKVNVLGKVGKLLRSGPSDSVASLARMVVQMTREKQGM
jgi:hypothetical protein